MERKKATDLMFIDSSPAVVKTELLSALSAELGYSVDVSDPWAVVAMCLLPFIVQTRSAADAGIKAHNVAFATGTALDILGAGCGLKRGGVSRAVAFVDIVFNGILKPGGGVYELRLVLDFINTAREKATFSTTQTVWVNSDDSPFEKMTAAVFAPEDGEEYNNYSLVPDGENNKAIFRSLNDPIEFSPELGGSTDSTGGRSEDEGDDAFAQRIYSRLYSNGRTGTFESYVDILRSPIPVDSQGYLDETIDATAIGVNAYNTLLERNFSSDDVEQFRVLGGDVVAVGLSVESAQDFSHMTAWGAKEATWDFYQRAVQDNSILGQYAFFRPALGFLPFASSASLPVKILVTVSEEDQNDETYESIRAAFKSFVEWQTTALGRAWSMDECTCRIMTAGAQHVVFSTSGGKEAMVMYYPTPEIGYIPSKYRIQADITPKDVFALYIGGELQ